MAIDLTKEFNPENYDFEILREWTVDGHQVAAARFRGKNGRHPEQWSPQFLFCDRETGDGTHDADDCFGKAKVREMVATERRTMHGEAWKAMPLEEAILDIHARVEAGQWLGQHHAEMIYVQEVAALLEADQGLVRAACDDLYAKRKLQLNGMILRPFERRFRLPRGLASVIIRFVGDPLGYPNGDAGGGAVADFEARVQKILGCQDGAEAFGSHWPDMDPAIVAEIMESLVVLFRSAQQNQLIKARVLKGKQQVVPETWLEHVFAEHPEFRKDVLREYRKEIVRLVRDRIMLYRSYAKQQRKQPSRTLEDDVLEEVAKEFEAWTAHFRAQVKNKPRKQPR